MKETLFKIIIITLLMKKSLLKMKKKVRKVNSLPDKNNNYHQNLHLIRIHHLKLRDNNKCYRLFNKVLSIIYQTLSSNQMLKVIQNIVANFNSIIITLIITLKINKTIQMMKWNQEEVQNLTVVEELRIQELQNY